MTDFLIQETPGCIHVTRPQTEDSPVSGVHGCQRGQVVGAAEVPVQAVLSGGEVSGGDAGGVGGEELH